MTDVEAAFQAYFDEIRRCKTAGCYWALLHRVVAVTEPHAVRRWLTALGLAAEPPPPLPVGAHS